MLILSEEARNLLKKPFGILYPDFSRLIPEITGKFLCTVGDVVTRNTLNAGIIPSLSVVDGITKRTELVPDILVPEGIATYRIENPPGTITDELTAVLRKSLETSPAMIIVDGEEDLAVIPLLEILPEGAVLLYGQPNEGAVLCEVTPQLRASAQEISGLFLRQ